MSTSQAAAKTRSNAWRAYRKIALSIALLLAAAAALIGGAFATFTDTVTAGSQAISSGTIKIAVGPTNDAATGATNIAAGETIAREADLNSTGATLANKEFTLKLTASPTSLLDTDPTNGLQVSIQACSERGNEPKSQHRHRHSNTPAPPAPPRSKSPEPPQHPSARSSRRPAP